jgi:PAS domain-containing protein
MVALLFELMALLTVWLCLSAWQRDRNAPGRRLFMALCLGVALWSAANLATLHAALPPRVVDAILYLGLLSVPVLWLALALRIRGGPVAERSAGALALLLAPGAACYVILLTGDPDGWFLRRDAGGAVAPGPLWWIHAGYSWVIATAGSVEFVRGALQTGDRQARVRRLGTGLVSLTPILASVLYVGWGRTPVDPTPLFLGATLVMLRSELYAGDLFQALPISHHDLISHIPTPLVLTDLDGRVLEINPAAQLRLAVARIDALDRSLDALLDEAPDPPRFERWPLVAGGREAGGIHLIVPRKREVEASA